ncbi:MAG: ABC transporter ATP-binding protein, partial [Nitrospinota bacterium]
IGPNGAGKTTFFHLLTGTLTPTSGRIRFLGEEITGLPRHQIVARGIARSYQKVNLFKRLSVFDNILTAALARYGGRRFSLFGKPAGLAAVHQQVERILEEVGLTDVASLQAQELSYGDQRLLEIAIALANQPRLLLLDEPTSGLGPTEITQITSFVHRLAQNYTILLIEHNMELVMDLADVISVMNFGEIIAEGTPEEIRHDARARQAYLGGDLDDA